MTITIYAQVKPTGYRSVGLPVTYYFLDSISIPNIETLIRQEMLPYFGVSMHTV